MTNDELTLEQGSRVDQGRVFCRYAQGEQRECHSCQAGSIPAICSTAQGCAHPVAGPVRGVLRLSLMVSS